LLSEEPSRTATHIARSIFCPVKFKITRLAPIRTDPIIRRIKLDVDPHAKGEIEKAKDR
jgi:hypothetical protein